MNVFKERKFQIGLVVTLALSAVIGIVYFAYSKFATVKTVKSEDQQKAKSDDPSISVHSDPVMTRKEEAFKAYLTALQGEGSLESNARQVLLKALSDAGPASYPKLLSLPPHLAVLERASDRIDSGELYLASAFYYNLFTKYDEINKIFLVDSKSFASREAEFLKVHAHLRPELSTAREDILKLLSKELQIFLATKHSCFRESITRYAILKDVHCNDFPLITAMDAHFSSIFLPKSNLLSDLASEPVLPTFVEFQDIWKAIHAADEQTPVGEYGNLIEDEKSYKKEIALQVAIETLKKGRVGLPGNEEGIKFTTEGIQEIFRERELSMSLYGLRLLCIEQAILKDNSLIETFSSVTWDIQKRLQQAVNSMSADAISVSLLYLNILDQTSHDEYINNFDNSIDEIYASKDYSEENLKKIKVLGEITLKQKPSPDPITTHFVTLLLQSPALKESLDIEQDPFFPQFKNFIWLYLGKPWTLYEICNLFEEYKSEDDELIDLVMEVLAANKYLPYIVFVSEHAEDYSIEALDEVIKTFVEFSDNLKTICSPRILAKLPEQCVVSFWLAEASTDPAEFRTIFSSDKRKEFCEKVNEEIDSYLRSKQGNQELNQVLMKHKQTCSE